MFGKNVLVYTCSKMFYHNWVCLVSKWLMDSVEVFSTLPDLPNSHIVKNPKNTRKVYFYIKSPHSYPHMGVLPIVLLLSFDRTRSSIRPPYWSPSVMRRPYATGPHARSRAFMPSCHTAEKIGKPRCSTVGSRI